jgi:hypothetical protein
MRSSEQTKELDDAMATTQARMKPALKESTNPAYRSRYADLASVWAAWQAEAPQNGLAAWFDVTTVDSGIAVTTLITHKTGQFREFGPLVVPLAKHDAHGVGSAITYGKRFGFSAAVAIMADEDDDGNAAVGKAVAPPAPRIPRSAPKTLANAPVGGGMPPQSEEETRREAEAAFPPLVTDAAEEDRAALVDDLGRLGELLKLDATAKRTYVKTYLGGADPQTADLAALSDLVNALRARAGEPKR